PGRFEVEIAHVAQRLASVFSLLGRAEEALPLLQEAAGLCAGLDDQVLPEREESLAAIQLSFARAYHGLRRWNEADEAARAALSHLDGGDRPAPESLDGVRVQLYQLRRDALH